MATKPGLLTQWPWQKLGSFKYLVITPFVAESVYSFMTKDEGERDLSNLLIFPFMLWRVLHNQIWISLSRFQTARSKHRIVQKGIDFEQVDREGNWDDQILLNGIFMFLFSKYSPGADHLPFWNTKGIVITTLLHVGPVEFLYYWLHRALHHHYLYARYHSHHHSSIVTEPITAVIHPFAEHLMYFALFTIPLMAMLITRTNSIVAMAGYETYIDFMNNLGHCNFELVPKWLFDVFPPLKYLMYTPSFHSLHHTQFRTNYALFMPMYDYLYGTADKSSDSLYEASHKGRKEMPDVVHLTHPTTLHSIYHLRLAFAGLASKPYASKWYLWAMWPVTWASMLLTWMLGSTFTVERNKMDKLKMQTWAIPRYTFQYLLSWQRAAINSFIEKAILEANEGGVKVISLGLLNQGEELNRNGELYIQLHPNLNTKIVDGTSLAVAVVLNSIPQGTTQVLLRGNLTKTGYAVALALLQMNVQVVTVERKEFEKLKLRLPGKQRSHLVLSNSYTSEIWLVGDGLTEEEQRRAPKGTRFIPFSQFPPKKERKDCIYYSTPAMGIPKALEDMHACENWLPRRVLSAWRVAGIVHALEGWDVHECGDTVLNVDKVWLAALQHGFLPLSSE
ncbi:protein ECERIFERUM 1-like protein isoform X1 [Cinnamomum micranthum f. kanehirae]|uniref:Protein ECERIFERUM 1-like protein isoform X1 n=1 Tax=Cinnamomum micranthum f. kanehirae TaxID=337451 RepID=A0A3S3NS68_9MAGN|nr:protein ECERIFERUM 1-like protein isoform X1 [Cinnamomum micranthum f. kanehirae]